MSVRMRRRSNVPRLACVFALGTTLIGFGTLTGCGGGTRSVTRAGTGSISIAIRWPAQTKGLRTRLIPSDSQYLLVTLQPASGPALTQSVKRPTSYATFTSVPVGTLTGSLQAFAQDPTTVPNQTPQAVGLIPADVAFPSGAAQTVTVTAGQQISVPVTLKTTISFLTISPPTPPVIPPLAVSPSIPVIKGKQLQLTATAWSSDTPPRLVPLGSTLSWSVPAADKKQASVSSAGQVTGLTTTYTSGTDTPVPITVIETESGAKATANVSVTPPIYIADSLGGQVIGIDDRTGTEILANPGGFVHSTDIVTTILSLAFPVGIASDSQSRIYVCDPGSGQVLRYANFNTAQPPAPLSLPSGLLPWTPLGIAIDGQDNLYITDPLNHRIVEIDTTGKATYSQVPFTKPIGITVDATHSTGATTILYVTDANPVLPTVYRLNGIGDLSPALYHLDTTNVPSGSILLPIGIDVDTQSQAYVTTDVINPTAKTLTSTSVVRIAGLASTPPAPSSNASYTGSGATALLGATGIGLDSSGYVYVSDTLNHRVIRLKAGSTGFSNPTILFSDSTTFPTGIGVPN